MTKYDFKQFWGLSLSPGFDHKEEQDIKLAHGGNLHIHKEFHHRCLYIMKN